MKEKKLLLVICISFTIILVSAFAYFVPKVKLNGRVLINTSDIIKDNELVAVRIKNDAGTYTKTKNIPLNGYILNNEESYCGIKQDDGTYSKEAVEITYKNGKVTIDKVNKNGMKCFLYFDKALCQGVACEAILANNSVDTSRISGEFTSIFEENTAGRIFKGPEDDYGSTTYIFAGANPNNWVQFAGKWWRIIRVNGDGSIRLIYAGSDSTKEPQTTGEATQIGTSAFNTSYNDNAYVGYMYGQTGQSGENAYGLTHANINSSTIKGVLDKWYANNIGNNENYSNKIAINVGFYGDRKISTVSRSEYGTLGYGTNATAYAAVDKFRDSSWNTSDTQIPSMKCSQANDLFTINVVSKGNKALTYPVGLITADEISFAGGYYDAANSSYWLYTNQTYWTMTPYRVNTNFTASVFDLNSTGGLGSYYVNTKSGVRPVINLKADIKLTGSGTTTDPYIVS